jgi:hypothetical protein
MRLQILENGHRPFQKAILSLIGATSGGHAPGPVLMMSYRRELFGKYLAACFQEGMRAAREWSLGEVELFAACVSRLNECKYPRLIAERHTIPPPDMHIQRTGSPRSAALLAQIETSEALCRCFARLIDSQRFQMSSSNHP